jgi:hypothetical protein
MKKIIRLTESDLTRIVRRVIKEQAQTNNSELLMGSVNIQGESVSKPFYKYDGGNGTVMGKTFANDNTKGYILVCSCKDKITKLSTGSSYTEVKVNNPNWERFC